MIKKNEFEFAPITVGTMRLGQWGANMNTKELAAFIDGCLALGLNDIDHADIYGNYTTESDFGKLLHSNSQLRGQLKIITKCGIKMKAGNRPDHRIKSYDSSANHIKFSVENSLKNLNTDYIDLLLLHRPDLLMDPAEIAKVFEELRISGKVKHFGVSNFTPSQFHLLNSFTPLITNQIEVSLTYLKPMNDGTLDQCLLSGVKPMAWSPLGGGGLLKESVDPRNKRIQQVGNELCIKHNASLDQILLAWLLKHPSRIIPVLGTTKLDRIQKAKNALNIQLTREDWYELLEASTGHEVA